MPDEAERLGQNQDHPDRGKVRLVFHKKLDLRKGHIGYQRNVKPEDPHSGKGVTFQGRIDRQNQQKTMKADRDDGVVIQQMGGQREVMIDGGPKYTGQALVAAAQRLYRLAMPRVAGKDFVGPPLVQVTYASFWVAVGLFQKVTFISEGAFDRHGYPTLITLRMEFARHFGRGPEEGKAGVYKAAEPEDLVQATAEIFKFNPNKR